MRDRFCGIADFQEVGPRSIERLLGLKLAGIHAEFPLKKCNFKFEGLKRREDHRDQHACMNAMPSPRRAAVLGLCLLLLAALHVAEVQAAGRRGVPIGWRMRRQIVDTMETLGLTTRQTAGHFGNLIGYRSVALRQAVEPGRHCGDQGQARAGIQLGPERAREDRGTLPSQAALRAATPHRPLCNSQRQAGPVLAIHEGPWRPCSQR